MKDGEDMSSRLLPRTITGGRVGAHYSGSSRPMAARDGLMGTHAQGCGLREKALLFSLFPLGFKGLKGLTWVKLVLLRTHDTLGRYLVSTWGTS